MPPPPPTRFVVEVDLQKASQLEQDLKSQQFQFKETQGALFTARKPGVTCTLYRSGKLVVQGKQIREFIEFYLEPNILCAFPFSNPQEELGQARIGVDEAGKGDFFGPLCIAGVFADESSLPELQQIGVQDSKKLSDMKIVQLGKAVEKAFHTSIVTVSPLRYNELYQTFRNLNALLGWGHATVIERLVRETGARRAHIDQFAAERVVIDALKKKHVDIELTQKHKGESDLVVAAASILARKAFVEGIEKLSEQWEIELPKGASQRVIDAGVSFAQKHGKQQLEQVAKLHFRTLDAISSKIAV